MSDVSKMITPELVMTLLTQNQEFKQLLIIANMQGIEGFYKLNRVVAQLSII